MACENDALPGEIHLDAASLDDTEGFSAERYDSRNERVAWLHVTDDPPKQEE